MGRDDQQLAQLINRSVNIGLQSEDLAGAVVGKVAVLQLALTPKFREYARQIVKNSRALSQALYKRGIPIVGYDSVHKGTDSHLVLANVHAFRTDLTGHIAAKALERIGIQSNKNLIPRDLLKPHDTSGVRFGTAALSVLGMKEKEMELIADMVYQTLSAVKHYEGIIFLDNTLEKTLLSRVRELRQSFPKPIFDA
jgi:glycine hydroxymethyltransferase